MALDSGGCGGEYGWLGLEMTGIPQIIEWAMFGEDVVSGAKSDFPGVGVGEGRKV